MGFNSPLPVRLQDETRKAAKIMRSFVDSRNNGLDKVVPRNVLEKAAGFAIFTVFKAGFMFSARAGSGVVIARTQDGSWSPPSAIGLGGFGFGGQAGAEVTDFLIVLNNRAAVASFMSAGNLTLGGNLSVAVGPLGRNGEASGAVNTKGRIAAMYSYSKTKGLFGGVSVEGSVIVERQDANRIAYGGNPSAKQILSGTFDPPDWANVLIEEIERCTGLPGGQRWKSRDEDGEGGGMGLGWDSPTGDRGDRPGSGYVFGQGVGAGGNNTPPPGTPPIGGGGIGVGGRKRAGTGGSLNFFGIGGGGSKGGGGEDGSRDFGDYGPDTMRDGTGGSGRQRSHSTTSRPGMTKRSSSFNPFTSGGTSSPKRTGPVASSESYNAGLTWDSSGPIPGYGTRSRAGSNARRPYDEDLLQRDDIWKGITAKKDNAKNDDLLGDYDYLPKSTTSSASTNLLGTWDADDRGLSANFSKLSTNNNGNRSRSNSKPIRPFDDILEQEYIPFESESRFASPGKTGNGFDRFDVTTGQSQSPFSDHTGDYGRTNGRAFEDYMRPPSPTPTPPRKSDTFGPKPNLSLKPGLENSDDGLARAMGLFEFVATDQDDLGFKRGQIIVVLDIVGNGDWWRGRNATSGKEGIFPCNYVEVLEIPKQLRGGVSRSALKKRVISDDFD